MTGNDEDWEAYAKARNQKGRIVAKDLQQGHRKRVEDVTKSGTTGLWRLAKWARTRGQAYDQGTIPTLEAEENGIKIFYKTPEERVRVFQKVFFPEPPPADLSNIPEADYPQDIEFPVIKEWEVEQAVRRAPADKAPGDDNIPNGILHIVLPIILPILTKLFNACMALGYNPAHFRHSVTVTLQKPDRKSYWLPNSY
jgi:hypothetical protein